MMTQGLKSGFSFVLLLLAVGTGRGLASAAPGETVDSIDRTIREQYQYFIAQEVQVLKRVLAEIQADPVLHQALADGDREAILKQALPIFDRILRYNGITHFYFHQPDMVNLLRVHQPDHHGDRIKRFTTSEAFATGGAVHGVELGAMGTPTLRMVVPWYATGGDGKLIGLVELGIDVDRVFAKLEKTTRWSPVLLVRKDLLSQSTWEDGTLMLRKTMEWNRFPGVVLTHALEGALPAELETYLNHTTWANWGDQITVADGGKNYRVHFIPIPEVRGRTIGQLMVLEELTGLKVDRNKYLTFGGIAVLLVAGGAILQMRRGGQGGRAA